MFLQHNTPVTAHPCTSAFHPCKLPVLRTSYDTTHMPAAACLPNSNRTPGSRTLNALQIAHSNGTAGSMLMAMPPCRACATVPHTGPGPKLLHELGPGQQIKAMVRRLDPEAWKSFSNVQP